MQEKNIALPFARILFKPIAFVMFVLIGALGTTIVIDGYRAYKGTESGDRWRLFMYYQTVRTEGVPSALEKYGQEVSR